MKIKELRGDLSDLSFGAPIGSEAVLAATARLSSALDELADLREGVHQSREEERANEKIGIGVYRRNLGREMDRHYKTQVRLEETQKELEEMEAAAHKHLDRTFALEAELAEARKALEALIPFAISERVSLMDAQKLEDALAAARAALALALVSQPDEVEG